MAQEGFAEPKKKPVEELTPQMRMVPVKRDVESTVTEGLGQQQRDAQKLITEAFNVFDKTIEAGGNIGLAQAWKGSSLKSLLG